MALLCLSIVLILQCTSSKMIEVDHGQVKVPIQLVRPDKHIITVYIQDKHSTLSFVPATMMISLSSSESTIFKKCPGFTLNNFQSYFVTPDTNDDESTQRTLDFSQYSVSGFDAKTNINIHPDYWSTDAALVATSCKKPVELDTIYKKYLKGDGVLGLGYDGKAAKNFKNKASKSFAIEFYGSGGMTGSLVFKPNTTKEIRGPAINTLKPTDDNWRISGEAEILLDNIKIDERKMNIVFDIDYNYIGFPKTTFDTLVKQFARFKLWKKDKNKPNVLSGYDWVYQPGGLLPTITITVGDNVIDLDLEEYLISVKFDHHNDIAEHGLLRMTATSDNTSWIGDVNKAYTENTIILGKAFLERYYTVFNMEKKEISYYKNEDLIQEKLQKEENERVKREEEAEKKIREAEEKRQADEKFEQDKIKSKEASDRTKLIVLVIVAVLAVLAALLYWRWYKATKLSNDMDNTSYGVAT